MKANEIYFDKLADALDSFVTRTEKAGGVFAWPLALETVATAFNGGVKYGQTVSRSFELATLKGKKTKQWAHCTLYRMDSGRYELTSYIL